MAEQEVEYFDLNGKNTMYGPVSVVVKRQGFGIGG
jgi:hypothetical protein